MDALIKLFSSLKVYWKTIIITLTCNALIIYLICFQTIPTFKDYPLSKEIILSVVGSLCYSTIFYLLSTIFLVPYFFVRHLVNYNIKCLTLLNFIISGVVLISFTIYELFLIILFEGYSFNTVKVLVSVVVCSSFLSIMAPAELFRIILKEKNRHNKCKYNTRKTNS